MVARLFLVFRWFEATKLRGAAAKDLLAGVSPFKFWCWPAPFL